MIKGTYLKLFQNDRFLAEKLGEVQNNDIYILLKVHFVVKENFIFEIYVKPFHTNKVLKVFDFYMVSDLKCIDQR
jgi:hypothetical protein